MHAEAFTREKAMEPAHEIISNVFFFRYDIRWNTCHMFKIK